MSRCHRVFIECFLLYDTLRGVHCHSGFFFLISFGRWLPAWLAFGYVDEWGPPR